MCGTSRPDFGIFSDGHLLFHPETVEENISSTPSKTGKAHGPRLLEQRLKGGINQFLAS